MAFETIKFARKEDDETAVEVQVNVGRMTPDQLHDMHSQFGNAGLDQETGRLHSDLNLTRIHNTALSFALKGLYVNDREIKVPANKPLKNLPVLENDEYMDAITDEVLKRVVARNKALGRKPPFDWVFGRYMPEDAETEDPTDSPQEENTSREEQEDRKTEEDSSTGGPSSSSETPRTEELTQQPGVSGT